MNGLLYGKVPKVVREVRVEREGTSNIQNVLMFSFHDTILLRRFHTRPLMNDSFRKVESGHEKLRTIITSNALEFLVKLSFDKGYEVN